MKIVFYSEYGSPDVLKLREARKPVPKGNEVLIKVHHSSINEWDWSLIQGKPFINRLLYGLLKPKRQVPGADIAGRVEAVGQDVKQFKPGDEVFGDLWDAWGAFAEYVCVSETSLTKKPSVLSFEEAAAVPQAGLMALQGLQYIGKVKPEHKVLINGAGGGVGTFAVQIVKSAGAEVTGVDRGNKLEMVRSIGADHVIDYTKEDFAKNGMHYDLILDVAGYRSIFDYKRALSPEGVYVMVGGYTSRILQALFLWIWGSVTRQGKKIRLLGAEPNKGMASMIELLETGKVVPVIDRSYSLSEVSEAYRYFGTGKHKGKIVIRVMESRKPKI